MSMLRAPLAVLVAALIAGGVAQVWPVGAAPVGAGVASLGLLVVGRMPLPRAALSTFLAAVAAFALRWAVVATMTPAYPERAEAVAGAGVSASVAALVVWWVSRDVRRGRERQS